MPAKSATGKVNLADVAALAGVSAPTVSKVINGRDDVADATRARVREALGKLGYESPAQRRSRSAGPALVDLVFHGLHSSYSLEVMAGIVECAAEEGVEIVLSGVKPAKLRTVDHVQWSQRLAESGRKGLILVTSEVTAGQLASFRRRNIPVVVIDPLSPPSAGYVSIGATNWAGGQGRHGAPDRPGSPEDRLPGRAGGGRMQRGPAARLPGGPPRERAPREP
jgi:LacI family transcriptional regulator